jgi:AmmeMemoRadiSam system protein A
MLSEVQRAALLDLARRSIVAAVSGTPSPMLPEGPLPNACGVFVTIKRYGELRGCLGTLHCRDLGREVARCASDAAREDPRFPPVATAELPEMSLEVSVLGPLEPIDPRDPQSITIGQHGLVVEQGAQRGLLLPQVATEWGWTTAQFLRQACLKAGLSPDAWQHGATVLRFEAEVFGE